MDGGKLPPGYHVKGDKIVYGHGSHAMSFPKTDFQSTHDHFFFSDAGHEKHGSAGGSASSGHAKHGSSSGSFSHVETSSGQLPPGFKMEGGKMVYSKSGHFDFSGDGGKLPPGYHLKGDNIVYGQGSHSMSFPEVDFQSKGDHVFFSDAGHAKQGSSRSGSSFSHVETSSGQLPPGFKMEGGKMVYSKSGHFDFSGDGGKLPPGYHLKGDNIVYGQGSHSMSFPEVDFQSKGDHVFFSDAGHEMHDGTGGFVSGGHAKHGSSSSGSFSHVETSSGHFGAGHQMHGSVGGSVSSGHAKHGFSFGHIEQLPPGFKMEGGQMVFRKVDAHSSGGKVPPGYRLEGDDIVIGHGRNRLAFPEVDFEAKGDHFVFDADREAKQSAAGAAAGLESGQHGGAQFTLPPGFKMQGDKMVWTKGGDYSFDGTGKLPPGYRWEGDNIVYGQGSLEADIPSSMISTG